MAVGVTDLVVLYELEPAAIVLELSSQGTPGPTGPPGSDSGAHRCRAYASAAYSLADNTPTAVPLDSEHYDTDGFHSTTTNTERLTVPTTGVYTVGGHVSFDVNASGYRYLQIRKNGTDMLAGQSCTALSGGTVLLTVVTTDEFSSADFVELIAFQNSGGALNLLSDGTSSPVFWIRNG